MSDYSPEDVKRDIEATERAKSRSLSGSLIESNINSHIAALTDIARAPLTHPKSKISLEKSVGMFSYLRDMYSAQTVGEAMKSLADRKVNPKVVELWIAEGMAVNPLEYEAIEKGYPELQEELKKARDKVFKES